MIEISIVLPIRNEETHIRACMESILAQDYPTDRIEILAVDGMSDDRTREILAEIQQSNPQIRILDNPERIVTHAVNIGIQNAQGLYIARMDAHATYAPDYLSACMNVMKETGADNVGGPAVPIPGAETSVARAIMLAHLSPFGLGGASFRNPDASGYVKTVWPGFFKKEIFDRIGLLNPVLTRSEDIDLNTRIIESGGKIYLSPKIKVSYCCRSTLTQLWKQRFQDGMGVIQTLPIHAAAVKPRHLIPLGFVLSLLLLSIFSAIWANTTFGFYFQHILLAGVLLYGLASAFFTLKNILQSSTFFPNIFLLPAVFIVLHFSYGFGSLCGLVQFRVLSQEKNQ